MRAGSSMAARFFTPSGISKRFFGLDLALIVRAYPTLNQRLKNFCTLNARASACALDHQNSGLRALLRETLTIPSERSTYAVPQSVGMFVIKGSTTTFLKHDSAPGRTMIGADVIPFI